LIDRKKVKAVGRQKAMDEAEKRAGDAGS